MDLQAGATVLSPFFLPTSFPLHPHFDLPESVRSSEEEGNFIFPGRFSIDKVSCLPLFDLPVFS
jgi:hypothetical protein